MKAFQRIAGAVRDFRYTKYIVILSFFVLIVGFVDDNSYVNRRERLREIERLQKGISSLKEKYEEDTRRLESLEQYDNVVRLAREKYLMKRPNEDIYLIGNGYVED